MVSTLAKYDNKKDYYILGYEEVKNLKKESFNPKETVYYIYYAEKYSLVLPTSKYDGKKTYYKIDDYKEIVAEPYKEYFDSNQYYRQVSGGEYQSLRDIAEDPSSGTTGWYIEEKTSSFEPFLFLSNATYEIVKLTARAH